MENNQRIGYMLHSKNIKTSSKFDDLWYTLIAYFCYLQCAYATVSSNTDCRWTISTWRNSWISHLVAYTSRCWNLSVTLLFIVSRSLAHAAEADLQCSICSKKSITCGSVHGHPRGASEPATHPRWPPFGVTINKQFEFSWGNNKKISGNLCLQAQNTLRMHSYSWELSWSQGSNITW